MRTIEFTVMKLHEIQRSEKIRLRCGEIGKSRFPRRMILTVDEVFLPHMLEKVDRHMFLVLDGPSQVGKTTFCKLLCKDQAKEYVGIYCSALSTAPNFHVLTDTTTTICWDEVNPSYVCQFRKLFQGPERAVNLCDAQSAIFSYTVDLLGYQNDMLQQQLGREGRIIEPVGSGVYQEEFDLPLL